MTPDALMSTEVAKSSGIATGRDASPKSEEREETIVITYETTAGSSRLRQTSNRDKKRQEERHLGEVRHFASLANAHWTPTMDSKINSLSEKWL